jgi:hypothetical protein
MPRQTVRQSSMRPCPDNFPYNVSMQLAGAHFAHLPEPSRPTTLTLIAHELQITSGIARLK